MGLEELNFSKIKNLNDLNSVIEKVGTNDVKADLTSLKDVDLDKFKELTEKSKSEESENALFFADIDEFGADAVFYALDADKDGKLDEEELDKLTKEDNDLTGATSEALKALMQEFANTFIEGETEEVPLSVSAAGSYSPSSFGSVSNGGSNGVSHSGRSSGTSRYSGAKSSSSASNNVKQGLSSDELEEEKKKTNLNFDNTISEKRELLDNTISQSNAVEQSLKSEHSQLSASLADVASKITNIDSSLSSVSSGIHNAQFDLDSMQAEFDGLETDGIYPEINERNKARKSALKNQITSQKGQIESLKSQEESLKSQKEGLLEQKTEIENNLAVNEEKIALQVPELKKQISAVQSEIASLESDKSVKISDLDGKIDAARKDELNNARVYGEMKGYEQSGAVSKLLELTTSDETRQFWEERYARKGNAYCASFASWAVEKTLSDAAKQMGVSASSKQIRFGHTVEGIRSWGIENNAGIPNINNLSDDEKRSLVKSGQVKPGMAFSYLENGRCHTGFIRSINEDLTWETIEGNTVVNGKKHTVGGHTRSIDNPDLTSLTDWTVRLDDFAALA